MSIGRQTQLTAATDHYADGEPAAQILERRWFAASAALKHLQAEYDVLAGVMELAEDALRRTCAQVAQLEALRDALGERLAAMDEHAAGRHTRASDEVQLSPVIPGRAAAGASLSHEQVPFAQGAAARGRNSRR